jgi:RNA polymerase sigma-70 factor (ECF subfamily)
MGTRKEYQVESRGERFQRLYETTHARVTTYAVRRTSIFEDAADTVAETFAIAWRRLEVIPGEGRELPWLLAVARKVIANRVRRTSSVQTLVHRLSHELAASVAKTDEVDAERLAALRALNQLSGEDREILMLVAWEGLTSRELGWALGCSPVAARLRLHRARLRLNQAWAGRESTSAETLQHLQEVPEP